MQKSMRQGHNSDVLRNKSSPLASITMSLSRFIWLAVAVLASLVVGAPATDSTTPNVKGFYLPYYNAILPQVDFKKAYSSGGRFAFIRVSKLTVSAPLSTS